MTLEIAAIVLLSAVLHPVWNAMLKHDTDKASAWWAMGVFFAGCALIHVVVAGHDLLAGLEIVWPYVLISTAGQVVYGMALVATYRRGDFSAYYPIVRSSPVFVIVVGVVFLGADYGLALIAGVAMVVVGAFLVQWRPGLRLLDDPGTLGLAVLAMCGTGIYAISDSLAMQHVPPPVMFAWFEIALLVVNPFMFRLLGQGWVVDRAMRVIAVRPQRYILPAVIGYASYALILEAYARGGDVAAVTAVRQASIPLSALIGGVMLKEGHPWLRLFASLVLAAGIVVVILAG